MCVCVCVSVCAFLCTHTCACPTFKNAPSASILDARSASATHSASSVAASAADIEAGGTCGFDKESAVLNPPAVSCHAGGVGAAAAAAAAAAATAGAAAC